MPDPQAFGLDPALLAVVRAQVSGRRAPEAPMADVVSGLCHGSPLEAGATAVLRACEQALAHLRPEEWTATGPQSPDALRERAWAAAHLPGVDAGDLAFRRLFPGLDQGIYVCSHSMGVPSVAALASVADHLRGLLQRGIAVWDDGEWLGILDRFERGVVELAGGDADHHAGVWFPNVSEALGSLLDSIPPAGGADEIVFTGGHFTTGHYCNHQWAANHGGRPRVVPLDRQGCVDIECVVDALGERTRIVSVSHALFESAWLQDVDTLAAEMGRRCPRAVLVVDAYQTAGTVPLSAARWGPRAVVCGGGHKQLRSSSGAGWAVLPRALVPELRVRRAGWWGHRDTWAFQKGPIERDEASAAKFRTGTPAIAPMVHLLAELDVLRLLGGGDLGRAVARARERSLEGTRLLIGLAREQGVDVRSPARDERRAGFVCLGFTRGRHVAEALAREGVQLDFRPDGAEGPGPGRPPGAPVQQGILRLSPGVATFDYELRYALWRAVCVERGQ